MRMSGKQAPHTAGRIPEHISGDVEVLPYNQRLHGTKFKRLQGVVDTEAVLASILTDLVEVLLDQLLLLHELDVRQSLSCKLNRLSHDLSTTICMHGKCGLPG